MSSALLLPFLLAGEARGGERKGEGTWVSHQTAQLTFRLFMGKKETSVVFKPLRF